MFNHFTLGIQINKVVFIVAQFPVLNMLYLLVNNYGTDDQIFDGNGKLESPPNSA